MEALYLLTLLFELTAFYHHLSQRYPAHGCEWKVAFSCIGALLMESIFATAAAVAGIYSLALVSGVNVVVGVLCYINCNKVGSQKRAEKPGQREALDWFLIGWTILALGLYLIYPTKEMLGSRDPGLYILNAMHISQEGTVTYETDEYLNDNYGELEGIVKEGYPGMFSPAEFAQINGQPGDTSPQFMPMFSSLLAIGYDLGEIEGLVRVNGIVGVLSILLLYFFAKEFLNQLTARLVLLFMLFEPAQLWGSRLTETEILSQLMFFLAMYLFTKYWDKKDTKYALLAGTLIGIGAFNRIDTYIYGAGLFVLFSYCCIWSKQNRKAMGLACAAYVFWGVLALVYGVFYSTAYFIMHTYGNGTLSGILLLNLGCIAVSLVIYAAGKRKKGNAGGNPFLWLADRKGRCIGAAVLLVLIYAALYFVRPLVKEGFDGHAMVEFGWYTSELLILLGIFGIYGLISQMREKSEKYLMFLVCCMASVVVYTIRPSITPDHIWAGRRWITVNIPFVILMGGYGISCLKLQRPILQKGLQAICIFAVTAFLIRQSSPFLFRQMLPDMERQYADILQDMDDDEVYFTGTVEIPVFFRYIYGKRIYRIDDENLDAVLDYIKEKGSILYMGSERFLGKVRFSVDSSLICEHTLGGTFLEKTEGTFPRKLFDWNFSADIYRLTFSDKNEIRLTDGDLQLAEAFWSESGVIHAKPNGGTIFYGPYFTLDPGDYELKIEVQGQWEDEVWMDVVCDSGNMELAKIQVEDAGIVSIPFRLEEETPLIEFRMMAGKNDGLSCRNAVLKER